MFQSFVLLFSFLLLPLSPLPKKKAPYKIKNSKKKAAVKKSKKKRGKTPFPSQPPVTSPQAKTTLPTHQSPQTPSPSYTPPSPITKIPLAPTHPTTPGSLPASTVIPSGTTNVQKTGVAIQKETLLVIQKIEPVIKQNSMNSQVAAELESIKKIITENKPLPKKSLILFAPDQQKIKGITAEAYTELYRSLLDYYKTPPLSQDAPPTSLTHQARTPPAITPLRHTVTNTPVTTTPMTHTRATTTADQLSLPQAPLKIEEPLMTPNAPLQTIPSKKTGTTSAPTAKKPKKNNKKSSSKTATEKQNSGIVTENTQQVNSELITIEKKETTLEQKLNTLIKEKGELEALRNQKIESMNATEEKLKNAEKKYQDIKKEYDKAIPESQSFFGINKDKKNNIEVMKKNLERKNAILGDIKEECIALQASIETLKNNIGEKDNEIREQLARINVNKEIIKHLKEKVA